MADHFEIIYTDEFVRQYGRLDARIKKEAKAKITLVADRANHKQLKMHKLAGALAGYYSFSVNYKYRIICSYAEGKKVLVLRTIGDHSIYE